MQNTRARIECGLDCKSYLRRLQLNRGWYKPDDCFVAGFKAIRNKYTKDEALVGRHGQISSVGEGWFQVILLSHRLAKQHLPEEQHPVRLGDEIVFRITEDKVKRWVKILKIYSNREPQLKLIETQMRHA